MPEKRTPSRRTRKSSPKKTADEGNGDSGGQGSFGGPPELGRNPDADPVRIHREYVQRRLGGGAPPTPAAYENALEQWRQIPGAVRGPAGEVHPGRGREAAGGEEADEAEPEQAEREVTREPETYEGPLPATDPGDNSPYEDGAR
ncbi:MAG: hypothetical protein L0H79_06410 [Intrasporangium sp.]|uniref:hypothetical protein n=1 Tax=Intrasporangium sp. TaxID=1925024 RepID=UPI002648115D|nr:hypothetical protein [Intrasporangium sp.]MDN5795370.1 hypothetical protein [Intrasporangium sp.]